jgi:hypothetical protein
MDYYGTISELVAFIYVGTGIVCCEVVVRDGFLALSVSTGMIRKDRKNFAFDPQFNRDRARFVSFSASITLF